MPYLTIWGLHAAKHLASYLAILPRGIGVLKMNTTHGRVLNPVGETNNGGYTRPPLQGPVRTVPAAREEKREYLPVDVESFPDEIQEAYAAYRTLRTQAAQARELFETAMSGVLPQVVEVPEGKEINYWYNYGLLNISIEPIKKKAAAKKANTITFNK
jgi:hypothetical protein